MTTVNGGTITYTLRGNDVNLAQTLARASSQAQMLAGKLGQVTLTVQSTTQAMAKQQAVMLATAQAQARLAVATGNHSQAAKILQSALGQVTNQTVQSINAQTQLTNVQKAAANGVTSLTGKIKDLAKEVGIFGALFIGKQVAGFVGDLISGANDLEKVKAKVQALSRSDEEYASTLKLASDQQKLFGGSLTENLDSLGAFLNLSQRTGVKLKDLENVARRLAIIDPIQGFQGAAVALKEFFSGDITSLSKRFEIPRSALNSLNAIEDPIAKFKEFDKVIADLGFTQEVLLSQTKTTAITYDQAGAALDNAKNAVGGYIAELLKVPTQVVTKAIFEPVATNLQFANQDAAQSKRIDITGQMLQNATSVDQFNASVQQANNTINSTSVAVGLLGGYFTSLSPTLFNAAKAAQENGVAFETINKGLASAGPAVDKATQALIRLGTAPGRTVEDITNINNQLAALAVSSDEGALQAARLANAFLQGGITANELKTALENIAASNAVIAIQFDRTAQAAALAATGGAAYNTQLAALGITQVQINQSLNDSVDAYAQELQKQAESEDQSRRLEEVKRALVDLMPAILNGSINEGNAAVALAQQFGIEEAAVRALIAAKRELASIGDGLLAKQSANTFNTGTGKFGGGATPIRGSQTNRGTDSQRAAAIEAQMKANEDLKASERELAIAQGGRAKEISILQSELAGLTQGTVEYNKTLTKLTTLQQQETKAGSKGGGAKLSAQDKLNNQLASNQDKYENNLEKSEIDHQQKLLDIQEEFAAKQLAAQRESEVSKRSSRADFYENLIDQDAVDQQKYSAQYEAAFAESQKLAQDGQLKLSQELLALRQKQINDDMEFEKKRNAVKNDKNLSKSEKEQRLKALDNVEKLRKDQQAAEEKALREGGDTNLNALNESLSAEEERYNEQTGKVTLAAQQAADARIANWQRANRAIAAEPPAELLAFGDVPTAQNPAAAVAANIPPAQVNQTTTTATDSTLQPPDAAMSVRIVELALVRDEGVISELQSLAARLEGKLNEVNGVIAGQTGTLSGKLDSIASAVRNIKSARLVNP